MRSVIALIFSLLAIISVVAFSLKPVPPESGKTPLTWVTDPNPQRDQQVATFNKLHPDCELSIDPDNSGVMKVIVQSSAKMGPDIIGQIKFEGMQIYYDAGILWDITDQAKEMGFGPDTLPLSARELVMLKVPDNNGNIVERQFVYPCNIANQYILYNKNVFDEHGISYPQGSMTWEEFIRTAEKLTTVNPQKQQAVCFGLDGTMLMSLILQKGAYVLNEYGTRATFADEKVVEACQLLHDLYYKYNIQPSPTQKSGLVAQGGWGGNMNLFAENKIAMLWGARWMLIQFRRTIADQKKRREKFLRENPGREADAPKILRLGACLPPHFEGEPVISLVSARCAGINVAGKNREKALLFLKYLASDEYSKLLNEGADSNAGNKKYQKLEFYLNPKYPGEEEVHKVALEVVPYGRAPRRSLFVSRDIIKREIKSLESKISSNPTMTEEAIRQACQQAANVIDLRIARNIKRQKHLAKLYGKLLKAGAEPIKLDLNEVNK